MSKHTKGDWSVDDVDSFADCEFIPVSAANGTRVCEVQPTNDGLEIDDEALANARLIAEAPAMLEALRRCLHAEEQRRKKLKDGAPASTYTDARLAEIRAILSRIDAK